MLERRLKCPRCGSRRIALPFDPPMNPIVKYAWSAETKTRPGALLYLIVKGAPQMTDFDAVNFIRRGYGNSDPIAQAWIAGVTGGIVVAAIISVVAYSDQPVPQLPLTTTATSVFETQPLLPVMPAPPAEATKR
jgi:hypothetical protein